jgi:predicted TIM-barrel fold metal-dependent hydrolase
VFRGTVVDVDVHNNWNSVEELVAYLPRRWQEYIRGPGDGRLVSIRHVIPTWYQAGSYVRGEYVAKSAGSDSTPWYDLLRRDVLDGLGVNRTVLTYSVGQQGGLYNPHFSAALARAANEWMSEEWLARDSRLYGSILVPGESPTEAAKEIRRWASDPRMCQILLPGNPLGKPFGHPIYAPIFDAAAETGRPVAIHFGSENNSLGRHTAGGTPGNIFEWWANGHQPPMHYVSSMISNGVFERLPSLKVLVLEVGFLWLPALAWRLDASRRLLAAEGAPLNRMPSEILREQLWVGTQPVDTVDAWRMRRVFEAFEDFEDMLCFAGDFPHFDADDPAGIARYFPPAWREKVFGGNAADLYGWDIADVAASGGPVDEGLTPLRA